MKKAAKKTTAKPAKAKKETTAPTIGWLAGSIGTMSQEEHIAKLNQLATEGSLTNKTQAMVNELAATKPQQTPENQSIAPLQTERTEDNQTETDSNRPESVQDEGLERSIPPAGTKVEGEEEGKIADPEAAAVDSPATILLATRAERLPGESRNVCWERLRKMARAAGLPRGQGPGTAYFWADEQIARIFAEDPEPIPAAEPSAEPEQAAIAVTPAPIADDQGVSGLSNLPPSWPELPANAQLQVEIAWVTANRLRVRDGTGVNLAKALSPAPSYSALSWLETSILFPAKFADISVKATADNDNEREHVRREKMAIEEIRSILAEMIEAKD